MLSGNGPELPMQVVQPYPTTLKRMASRLGSTPASCRYSVTTLEPGARLVFTHGCVLSPRSAAFLASRPAARSTDGFEVLVQLVMAAITTEPWCSGLSVPGGSATAVAVAPATSNGFD